MEELIHFYLRWIHFLAGITWIGILYYFNFVQTPFFAETEAGVRTGVIQKLVPRALWWFRWGAMFTFLAGILMYLIRIHTIGSESFFVSQYGVTITLGGLIGTIMFLNVWLVIWPNQQIVIASANQVAQGGQPLRAAAGAGRRAGLTSEQIQCSPFHALFMGAAMHYPGLVGPSAAHGTFWLITLIIIAAVEYNALVGTQGATKKPLDSVSGALWVGFLLTGIFYLLALGLLLR
jgi:uncharacterized membrane protein